MNMQTKINIKNGNINIKANLLSFLTTVLYAWCDAGPCHVMNVLGHRMKISLQEIIQSQLTDEVSQLSSISLLILFNVFIEQFRHIEFLVLHIWLCFLLCQWFSLNDVKHGGSHDSGVAAHSRTTWQTTKGHYSIWHIILFRCVHDMFLSFKSSLVCMQPSRGSE